MKIFKFFIFALLLSFCGSTLTLTAAPRTLEEIDMEQQQKKNEEKKTEKDVKKNKKQAEKQDKQSPEAANSQKQTTDQTAKHYTITEDVIGIPNPFVMTQIDNSALMNTDPNTVKLYQAAVTKEQEKDNIKNPSEIIKLWMSLNEINENNPFAAVAKARLSEWHLFVEVLDRYQASLDKISELIPTNIITAEQKVSIVSQHLDEFGVTFGTDAILNITKRTEAAAAIAKNEIFRNKIKAILKARCEKNQGKDCFSNGKYFAVSEEEKITYFSKACDMKYKAGCSEIEKIKAAEAKRKAKIAAEEKRRAEEEKRKIEEAKRKAEEERNRQIKDELNQAGRKKRIVIATSTLVVGAVAVGLGGFSFYEMSDSKKWHGIYMDRYAAATDSYTAEIYRKRAKKANREQQLFTILGSIGVGVGAALITTGIVFYSIEFDGEKEVKKKYNLSFGASPADSSLYFTLNW